MKKIVSFTVGIVAGYIGLKMAVDVVFRHFFEARFANCEFGQFARAMSLCENHSTSFFIIAFMVGASMCGGLLSGIKPKLIVGIISGLAAGTLIGALSGFIYFHNHYDY